MSVMVYTLFSILAPAIVPFLGLTTISTLIIIRALCVYAATGSPGLGILSFVPLATLGGLGFMKYEQSHYIFLLPVLCILLFLVHPVGIFAWGYTLYWLIPVYYALARSDNMLLRALATVFITHAIGSVLFLYTHDTQAIFWWRLIPQVALERTAGALCVWGAWWYHASYTALKAHAS